MNRPLPRRVRWVQPIVYGYTVCQARAAYPCDHLGSNGQTVAGPCVGHIRPGDDYLTVVTGPGPWRNSRLLLRCASAAGIVIDERLTPPLVETLLCASAGILLWCSDLDDPVWIRGDDGIERFSPVAQHAAVWLVRHDLIEVPDAKLAYMEPMTLTLRGRYEIAAQRAAAVRKMRG